MTDAQDPAKGDSVNRQRHGRILRYFSRLYIGWLELVARLLHRLILPLQCTPLAPMLRDDGSKDQNEHARITSICGALHSKHIDAPVLDMGAARSGTGERPVPTAAVPIDISQYTTWTSSGEEDHDGK
jgi:hypothetical protein